MRIRPSASLFTFLLAAASASAGCNAYVRPPPALPPTGSTGDFSINRGDWLVGSEVGVWKVMSQPRTGAPERIGYVTERHYREVRGGPIFALYEVTTLDRNQVIGMVDSLGNATRYRPRRGGGIDSESVGNATLERNVASIFDTVRPLTLEKTTERALAFEALDVDHNGYLDKNEYPRITDRVHSPDTNRDGKVDPQEFENYDDL